MLLERRDRTFCFPSICRGAVTINKNLLDFAKRNLTELAVPLSCQPVLVLGMRPLLPDRSNRDFGRYD